MCFLWHNNRAAVGLEAADYVIGGYWVWGKIIENLAEIGYTR
jgi:phospholipid:diacylglycerol acyltransferase